VRHGSLRHQFVVFVGFRQHYRALEFWALVFVECNLSNGENMHIALQQIFGLILYGEQRREFTS
jgi:hypothetical protein